MIIFPNAKINLGLNIVAKRPDNYHNLETIFYPIPLEDALEVVDLPGKTDACLHISGLQIDGEPNKNLIIRAYDLLKASFDLPAVDIYLHKVIPFGAGLGGGSSDAAFMLRLLKDKYKLPVSEEMLLSLAARLGADCPFFLLNRPVSYFKKLLSGACQARYYDSYGKSLFFGEARATESAVVRDRKETCGRVEKSYDK